MSINIEVKDKVIVNDERLEISIMKIVKRPLGFELSIKNISNESIILNSSNFYMIDEKKIYPTSKEIITLESNSISLLRLSCDGSYNDQLLVYNDGISVIKVPEFPITLIIFILSLIISIYLVSYGMNILPK